MKTRIEAFRLEPLGEGKFIHPKLARYRQDGEERSWEILEAHDSVAVLIRHRERKSFILVRQFRPAVYAHGGDGMTLELCAGLVDKPKPLEQIAAEEVEEECGYRPDPSALERVSAFYTSVGFAGSRQTLYYVEVDESLRVGPGGGIEGESIEVVELATEAAMALILDESVPRTPGLMFALCWWRDRYGSSSDKLDEK